MPPHQLRVLITLPLKLVDVLGGSRSKAGGLRLKQRQDVCIRTEIGDSRDLILRYGIEKHPAEVIAIVMLVITAQIGIILLTLIMIVRVARRRRLQTTARCDVAIQPVVAYLFLYRMHRCYGWFSLRNNYCLCRSVIPHRATSI